MLSLLSAYCFKDFIRKQVSIDHYKNWYSNKILIRIILRIFFSSYLSLPSIALNNFFLFLSLALFDSKRLHKSVKHFCGIMSPLLSFCFHLAVSVTLNHADTQPFLLYVLIKIFFLT